MKRISVPVVLAVAVGWTVGLFAATQHMPAASFLEQVFLGTGLAAGSIVGWVPAAATWLISTAAAQAWRSRRQTVAEMRAALASLAAANPEPPVEEPAKPAPAATTGRTARRSAASRTV